MLDDLTSFSFLQNTAITSSLRSKLRQTTVCFQVQTSKGKWSHAVRLCIVRLDTRLNRDTPPPHPKLLCCAAGLQTCAVTGVISLEMPNDKKISFFICLSCHLFPDSGYYIIKHTPIFSIKTFRTK
jgi:hypothetical protein